MKDLYLTRRAALTGAGVAGIFAALPRSEAALDETGQWSSPLDIGGQAIHAALMHTGYVLFFGYIEDAPAGDRTSYVGTWNYTTGAVGRADYSYPRDIFCAGMSFLRNGRLYVAGGHNADIRVPDSVGVAETDVFDPVTRTWTPGPVMAEKRWYPTQVQMPGGSTYIFGGWETDGTPALGVEVYDPTTGTLRRLPASANKELKLYPHMRLMPNGKLVKTGGARLTLFFDPATNTWANGPTMNVGNRPWGTSVAISGGTKVLTFGGRPLVGSAPTRTAEVLDLTAATPRWQPTGSLTYGRIHCNGVVLPDGTVLAVGGGIEGNLTGPVRTAELYDPATGTWRLMAAQTAGRMYHSTALLLPDGRVFSAGQNGAYATTAELYSPPYLFRGARPTVTSLGASVRSGATLSIASPEASTVTRVALMRSGSTTHQVNTDQRHLFLAFTRSGTTIAATVPANRNLAPPGRYLVFLLNGDGVPSVGRWVTVT